MAREVSVVTREPFAMRSTQFRLPIFLVLLIHAKALAGFGDVFVHLEPTSAPVGFGLSVDLTDELVIVGSGDPKLQQFDNTDVGIRSADRGGGHNALP